MRISCQIELINRNLASFNVKKRRQPVRSQLSIGRKPTSQENTCSIYLFLCSALDKSGTKFLIKDNVVQVFTKFLQEGKATIRLRDPQQDISISNADVVQLKSFLSVLKLALEGKPISDIALSSLAPASSIAFDKPKTNIIISSRKDYPICSSFPSTCESLQASNCGMKKIDGRILKLKHLTCLNLSSNTLQELPDDVGSLSKLSEFILSDNKLEKFPVALFRSTLMESLTVLDISSNQFVDIHPTIALLRNLVTLKLDRNALLKLPVTLGKLSKLRNLSAAYNKLSILPGSVLKLRLDTLDLFKNEFPVCSAETEKLSSAGAREQCRVPSLLEVAARYVKKHSIHYDSDAIYAHLCSYLDSARTCWCGDPCFESSTRRIQRVDLHKIASTVTALGQLGTTQVPFEIYLCSAKCVNNFNKNPRAYWR